MAVAIVVSAKGNYLYTTRSPMYSSGEGENKIGNDGEDKVWRCVRITNDEDSYVYKLRVKRADRQRNIYTQAKLKDVFT